MKKLAYLPALSLFVLPVMAFAQVSDVEDLITTITDIIGMIVPLLLAIGLVVFMWGLITYLMKAGDEEGQKGARSLMIYGIIILFVMVSVWGLVNILAGTFGGAETDVTPPSIPTN